MTREEIEQRMDELAREFYEENPRRDLQANPRQLKELDH
jgi:hypothetical protein